MSKQRLQPVIEDVVGIGQVGTLIKGVVGVSQVGALENCCVQLRNLGLCIYFQCVNLSPLGMILTTLSA